MAGKPSIKEGDVFYSNEGYQAVVIKYTNILNVLVEFQDEHKVVKSFTGSHLRKGNFRNPYHKVLYGFGYVGVGSFKRLDSNGNMTLEYIAWSEMIRRCYSDIYKNKYPTYKGCMVCEQWANFQVFSSWYVKQKQYGKGFQLDKDILSVGSKVYSPETCALVPVEINNLLAKNKKTRGALPIGVSKAGIRFRSSICKNKKPLFLGTFNAPEEAFYAYKEAKEKYIKEVANKYKDQIDSRTYEALMKYEVNIDD